MSSGESSHCRMLQHSSSLEPDIVTTLRRTMSTTLASCSAASGVQTCLFGVPTYLADSPRNR